MSQAKKLAGQGTVDFCQRSWCLCFQLLQKSIQNWLLAVFSGSIKVLVALELLKRRSRPIFAIYQPFGCSACFCIYLFVKKDNNEQAFSFV
jgi:hypothetical protein